MTRDDLDTLHHWSGFPAEHRLAAYIEAALSGPDYRERCTELAKHLGYTNPAIVNDWLSDEAIVSLGHLPAIARFFGIHLSVLVTLWIATFAADDDENDEISKSIAPRITDAEYDLIESARAVYASEYEDQLAP